MRRSRRHEKRDQARSAATSTAVAAATADRKRTMSVLHQPGTAVGSMNSALMKSLCDERERHVAGDADDRQLEQRLQELDLALQRRRCASSPWRSRCATVRA